MSLADSVYAHLEEIFGPLHELETDRINGERSWPAHLTSIEETEPGALVVTMGVATGMDRLASENARALFALIGERHPSLQEVIFVNGKGEHLGQAVRHEIPMLNQKFGRR